MSNGSQRILEIKVSPKATLFPCYCRPSRLGEHLGWLALVLASVVWPMILLAKGL